MGIAEERDSSSTGSWSNGVLVYKKRWEIVN